MFNLDEGRINTEQPLGQGTYGTIYPYQKGPNDLKWVVKRLRFEELDELFLALKEMVLAFRFEHPAVLSVRGYHINRKKEDDKEIYNLFMKLPRMEMNLEEKMRMQVARFPKEQVIRYFYTLACGIEYLHNNRIIHSDLKLQNILIKGEAVIISDFGCAEVVHQDESGYPAEPINGTICYMAPEAVKKISMEKIHLKKADSWSLALAIISLICRKKRGVNSRADPTDVKNDIRRLLDEVEKIEPDKKLREILSSLLEYSYAERKSVKEVRELLEEVYGDFINEELIRKLRPSQKYEDLQENIKRLESERKAMRSQRESFKEESQTFRRLAEVNSEISGNKESRINGLENYAGQLQERIMALENQIQAQGFEKDEIEKQNRQLQERVMMLDNQIQAQGADKDGIENHIQETRQEILKKVHSISQNWKKELEDRKNKLFRVCENALVTHRKEFCHLLWEEFKEVQALALQDLNKEISSRKDHGVARCYLGSFTDALEYDFRCLYKLYCSEWKTEILYWRLNYAQRLDWNLRFEMRSRNKEELGKDLRKEYSQVKDDIKSEIFQVLTEEIYCGFKFAEQQINKNMGLHLSVIPDLGNIEAECKSEGPIHYNPLFFLEIEVKKQKKIEDELETIKAKFDSVLEDIDEFVNQKSIPQATASILDFCLKKSDEIKNEGIAIIKTNFVYYLLLNSSYKLYKKKEEEIWKAYKRRGSQLEIDLRDVDASYEFAKRFIRENSHFLQKMIISEIMDLMTKAVKQRITKEALIENLDQKAYEKSFEARDYRNVVKYVVDTEKFKKEV